MRIQILYRSGDDELSEREISNIEIQSDGYINALCHLRNEVRSFVLRRIEKAIDLDTGEYIKDIGLYLGLSATKLPNAIMPIFSETLTPMSTKDSSRLRKADKHNLYARFKLISLMELYESKLLNSFGNRCFNCGSINDLQHDHHVPQALGGRFVAGNLVILCKVCNSRKLDKHPKNFYTSSQLVDLILILKKQVEMFDFQFNNDRYYGHTKEYLLELGLSLEATEREVDKLKRCDGVGISIGL